MKGGALDGLSIGYNVKKSSPGRGTTKRWLEVINLREISIVDEPSNDLARVTTVKQPGPSDSAYEKLQAALRGLAANGSSATDVAAGKLLASLRALA
jgi:phage head maturation protease